MKDFSRKEQKAAKDQYKDTSKQEPTENKQLNMKNINWQEMLEKDLGDQIKDLQKQIDASQKKRQRDLEHSIKIRKKLAQNEKKAELTKEEIDIICQEEEREQINVARLHIQSYMEKKKKMKLSDNQNVLLKKLVDTSMRQYYDTEGTQKDLYKLFFEEITKDKLDMNNITNSKIKQFFMNNQK